MTKRPWIFGIILVLAVASPFALKKGSSFFKTLLNGNFLFNFISLGVGANTAGMVRGLESVNPENEPPSHPDQISISNDNFLPIVGLQPVRKEGYPDLVLPDAHASLILDVDSGTILHYQKGKDRRQVASLTKIMTALLVAEMIRDWDEEVTITAESLNVAGTKVGCPTTGRCISQRLVAGEKISVRALFQAMLMNSTNDAATALAIHFGGSMKNFVQMMNERAHQLGLRDTNFCTPSGLEIGGKEDQCYSTAYDMARVVVQALKHDQIWQTMRIPKATLYSSDGQLVHEVGNTSELLEDMPNVLGSKTGFTPMAGYSLLLAAQDEEKKHRIVAVTLDNPYRWRDARQMVEWAFAAYEWK